MNKFRLLFLDFKVPFILKDVEFPVGGACVRQLALAKGLISLGHKVGILTWKGAKEYIGKDVELDLVESYSPTIGIRKLRFLYYQFPALLKAVKGYQPDFIFQKCVGSETGTMSLISKILKIPFVYMACNDIDADGRYKQRLGYLDSKIYEYGVKSADKIIAQNGFQMDGFRKRLKCSNVDIVYNPICCDDYKLSELKPLKDRKYIAWLAVFQPQKNLYALLDIIKRTPEMEYRIGGFFPPHTTEDMKAIVKSISSQPNVKMVGFLKRNEVIPFFSKAVALLNTSHYEGFSNTFLESWLAGTPVVTCSIDPDNIISTNRVGMVAKEYAEIPTLLKKLRTSKRYQFLARRCRDYVIQNHNAGNIAKAFIDSLPLQTN